jgi:hypothetical protein
MDEDTIFPALSIGEHIVGKYTHSECSSILQTTIILTNHRLLIRRKYTVLFCSPRSSYTSIALDSIERVDEEPAYASLKFVLTMFTTFFISIVLLSLGIQLRIIILTIVAVFGLVLPIVGLVLNYLLENNHLMLLYGTFGSETLKLPEALLRELEGKLIEMSYQRQSSSTSQPSTPSQPRGSAPYFAASGKNNFTNGEQRLRMQEDNADDF